MKRAYKIIIAFFLTAFLWVFAIDENIMRNTNKIIMPLGVLILLGIASLTHILMKVNKLEEHPNEKIRLQQEI